MQNTPEPRQSTSFTFDNPAPVIEELIALRQSAVRPRDVRALEQATVDNGQAEIWRVAMRIREHRLRRGHHVVRTSMARHVAVHLRGRITPRRPAMRAPVRSIGIRCKSTRPKPKAKPSGSIDGDPSSRRAPLGGAL